MKNKILSSCIITSMFMVGCAGENEVSQNIKETNLVEKSEVGEVTSTLRNKAEKIIKLFEEKEELSIKEVESIIYSNEVELKEIRKEDVEGVITYTDLSSNDKLTFTKEVESMLKSMEYESEKGKVNELYDYRFDIPRYRISKKYADGKSQKEGVEDKVKSAMEESFLLLMQNFKSDMGLDDIEYITGYKYSDKDIYKSNGEVVNGEGVEVKEITTYSHSEENEGVIIQVVDGNIIYASYSNATEDVEFKGEFRSYECVLGMSGKYIYKTSIFN